MDDIRTENVLPKKEILTEEDIENTQSEKAPSNSETTEEPISIEALKKEVEDNNMVEKTFTVIKVVGRPKTDKTTRLICTGCNWEADAYDKILAHIKEHDPLVHFYIRLLADKDPELVAEEFYKCHYCDQMPPSDFGTISEHNQATHAKVMSAEISGDMLERPFFPKEHPCPQCGKKFEFALMVDHHILWKHSIKKLSGQEYLCGFCSQVFPTPKSYSAHHKKEHPDAEKEFACLRSMDDGSVEHVLQDADIYKCGDCPADFGTDIAALRRHHRDIHSAMDFKFREATAKSLFRRYVVKAEASAAEHNPQESEESTTPKPKRKYVKRKSNEQPEPAKGGKRKRR